MDSFARGQHFLNHIQIQKCFVILGTFITLSYFLLQNYWYYIYISVCMYILREAISKYTYIHPAYTSVVQPINHCDISLRCRHRSLVASPAPPADNTQKQENSLPNCILYSFIDPVIGLFSIYSSFTFTIRCIFPVRFFYLVCLATLLTLASCVSVFFIFYYDCHLAFVLIRSFKSFQFLLIILLKLSFFYSPCD